MQNQISKSRLKAKALEYFREVEITGQPLIVTDHGKAKLEIRKYQDLTQQPLHILKGSVLKYEAPFSPVDDDAWDALK